jgi:protein SCO1
MSRTIAGWVVAGLLCLTCLASCSRPDSTTTTRENVSYPLSDFSLTERNGETVGKQDLAGKVWVAAFFFTRCSGPCPRISAAMEGLQGDFKSDPDVRLVSFTVDPTYDDAATLSRYAERFHADPQRWLFLRGADKEVYSLLEEGFKLPAEKNASAEPGKSVTHAPWLAVVDRRGTVRGYFDGLAGLDAEAADPDKAFEDNLDRLRRKVFLLRHEDDANPAVNAALNALAGLLLLAGFAAIRRRMIQLHVACMTSALAVSTVFLASYLYFHLVVMHAQPTYFHEKWPESPRWVEALYLGILGTHTVLAAATAPLALFTAFLGVRGRLARHVWIARWTLPIWLYVSITGVVVYWMLYRLY